ncbi:MAG: hypothetical protein JWM80_5448 [Cyanobacteria bacterium RYN_339]|nr:hypothetical protein [Cyanobacteria bacterium RYN_339]
MFKQLITAAAACTIALAMYSAPASAAKQSDIMIVNKTGQILKNIEYRAAGTQDAWVSITENGVAEWQVGEKYGLTVVAKYADVCKFEIRVTPSTGEQQEISDVTMCNDKNEGEVYTLNIVKDGSGVGAEYQ